MSAKSTSVSLIWMLVAVAMINMVAPFSIDTYLPAFPAMETFFSSDRAAMEKSLGIYMVTFGLAMLFWGPVSDRYGRRPVIFWNLLAYAVASLLVIFAQDIPTLYVLRFMQGLFAGGAVVASRALLRDAFGPREAQKAMATVMMLFSLAPAIAPMIGGGLLVLWPWESIFVFLGLYALVIWLLVWRYVPESMGVHEQQSMAPSALLDAYVLALKHKPFMQLVFAQSLMFGGFFIFVAGAASVIFDQLHLGEGDFHQLFAPLVTGMVLGAFAARQMAMKTSPFRQVNGALILMGAAILSEIVCIYVFGVNWWTLIAPLLFVSLALSLTMPVYTILGMDCFPDRRGLAAAIQGASLMVAAALVASFVLPLVHDAALHMVLALLGMWILSSLFWLAYRYGQNAQKPQ